MRIIFYNLFFLLLLSVNTQSLFAQSAHVQFIHDSPDPALPAIDIYIDGTLSYTNIAFRHATSFIALPSSGELSIGIASATNDTAITDTIKNINITLQDDSFYYFVISGLLDTSLFASNPDSIPVNFAVNIFTHATNSSPFNQTNCALQFFNGSTDASLFDLYAREQREMLFSEIRYAQFGPKYKEELTYQPVVIDLTNPINHQVISTYLGNFEGDNFYGKTALIFSSGFQNPSSNQNGSPFGLYAALTDGTVIPLADTAIASLQIIHNSADTNFIASDIYVNGSLWWSYLFFRTATPYIDVPANVTLHIGFAQGGSASAADVIDSFTTTFQNAASYVGMLGGVLNKNGFANNPNGKSILLNLFNKDNARQVANDSIMVDFFFFHGSTDEPAIDVIQQDSSAILANNISYGDTSGYSEFTPYPYTFNITSGGNPNNITSTYNVNLSLYKSKAITIFTSGFVDSVDNNSGPSFGLFGALNDGTVIQFPAVQYSAQVQFINNIADVSLSPVAIYVNGISLINNLPFRNATYFSGVSAGNTINLSIAPSNSSVAEAIANFNINLAPNSTNVIMLNGLSDTSGYAANPDGKNTAISLLVIDSVHTKSTQNMVNIRMAHGATDEPANDFVLDGTLPPFIDNIEYGEVKPYVPVTASTHTFNMTDASNDNDIIKKYIALFSSYSGTSLTVFSSGFLNPSANKNGAAFGIYAADTSGNVFPLTDVTGINIINSITGIMAYPNPSAGNIIINNKGDEPVYVQLTGINGEQIKDLGVVNNNSDKNFSLDGIADGIYIIRTISSTGVENIKLIIQR